jgi:2-C-methyl-D-erythritol 4-phosphate cytidylyltransferase
MNKPYGLIVTAAGSGLRFGAAHNKIFEPIHGIPTLIHSVRSVSLPTIGHTIITTTDADYNAVAELIDHYGITATLIVGGATRMESVQNALRILTPEMSGVFIHDAARPFPGTPLLDRLLNAITSHKAIIPGIAITDTIKQIDQNHEVIHTIPRDALVSVQTPQYFDNSLFSLLLAAIPDSKITDEAMILEKADVRILVVEGSTHNIKLTLPIDKIILEQLMPQSESPNQYLPDTRP